MAPRRHSPLQSNACASNGLMPGLQRALLAARARKKTAAATSSFSTCGELTAVFDYFVLASGTSRRQLHAMSEEIDHALEDRMGDRRLGIEGYQESRWILLDYGDVVIHLFEPETRAYYALEELWAQAKRVEVKTKDKGGRIKAKGQCAMAAIPVHRLQSSHLRDRPSSFILSSFILPP